MSAQAAPAVIDSLDFARKGEFLSGSLPLSALGRLKESIHDDGGLVAYRVQGGCDARGRPTLAVEVSGQLRLTCQRCLGAMAFSLRIASTLVVLDAARIAAGEADDDDEFEWLESSPELDLASLVEDEVILGLPYAARHGDGECRAGGLTAADVPPTGYAGAAVLGRGTS